MLLRMTYCDRLTTKKWADQSANGFSSIGKVSNGPALIFLASCWERRKIIRPRSYSGKESSRGSHILTIVLAKPLYKLLLLVGSPDGEKCQHQHAADSDGPICRYESRRSHQKCRCDIKGMPNPLVWTVRDQDCIVPCHHCVSEVFTQAG